MLEINGLSDTQLVALAVAAIVMDDDLCDQLADIANGARGTEIYHDPTYFTRKAAIIRQEFATTTHGVDTTGTTRFGVPLGEAMATLEDCPEEFEVVARIAPELGLIHEDVFRRFEEANQERIEHANQRRYNEFVSTCEAMANAD